MLILLIFSSCSKDEIISDSSQLSDLEVKFSDEGQGILKFRNTEDFLNEYSKLSKYKSEEDLNSWIKQKGHNALLTKSDSIFKISDSIGILYSDALMAILNTDAEFKIGEETIWLNNDKFYVLSSEKGKNENKISRKGSLKVIGSLYNLGESKEYNLTDLENNKNMDNANRWKTYIQNVGSKRLITELYNETIYFTDGTFSSQMFLRFRMDYESCSFWRCTWKNDTGTQRKILINLSIDSVHWNRYNSNGLSTNLYAVGHYNILLANYQPQTPFIIYTNFAVSGYIGTTIVSTGYSWTINNVSWYPNEN